MSSATTAISLFNKWIMYTFKSKQDISVTYLDITFLKNILCKTE